MTLSAHALRYRSPATLFSSGGRRKRRRGREREREREREHSETDARSSARRNCHAGERSREERANRSHDTRSNSLRPAFGKAAEGKRERDSPSAMLQPCARVLAFSAPRFIDSRATDTLVSHRPTPSRPTISRPPVPLAQPPLPPQGCFRTFEHPATWHPLPSPSMLYLISRGRREAPVKLIDD